MRVKLAIKFRRILIKRHLIILIILLITFTGSLCLAQTDQQTIKEDFKPSMTND